MVNFFLLNYDFCFHFHLQSHVDDHSSEHEDELKDSTSSDEGVNLSMRPLDLQRSHSHSDENLELEEQLPTVNGNFNQPHYNYPTSVGMDYPRVSTAARATPETQHSG